MKRFFNIFLTGLVGISLVSCAHYSAQPLCDLSIATKQHGIGIAAKALLPEESKKYLGKNLLSKGIQPIQLYIENDTDSDYIFDPKDTNLTLIPPEVVSKQFALNTGGRLAGTVLALPLMLLGASATAFALGEITHNPNIGAMWVPASVGVLATPIIVASSSAHHNDKVDRDYMAKNAKRVIIQPHTSFNCILFVSEQHKPKQLKLSIAEEPSGIHIDLKTDLS